MLLYRRLASPLHATRPTIGAAWALSLVVAGLVSDHPIVLGALALAVAIAGVSAGVGGRLCGSLRSALILGAWIVAVNVLVTRRGLTVFARLGDLGPFGQGDLTVEALVYGIVVALKVGVAMLALALAALAVDSDRLLRAVRRCSFRSALTASLATRMVGVLAGDAQRLAEAQRTRPRVAAHGVRARAALLSAIVASSLDRAMDVAATLELRGLAAPRPRARPEAWANRRGRSPSRLSRHDLAFAGCAALVPALALVGRFGAASFSAYPTLHGSATGATLALSAGLLVVVLAPFADRRGIEP